MPGTKTTVLGNYEVWPSRHPRVRCSGVSELRKSLPLGTHRLVTLTGPGGVGKTRLALELVRAEDEVCLVELAGLPRETTVDDLVVVAAALGVRDGARPRASGQPHRAAPARRRHEPREREGRLGGKPLADHTASDKALVHA
jgi:hypothetical protein